MQPVSGPVLPSVPPLLLHCNEDFIVFWLTGFALCIYPTFSPLAGFSKTYEHYVWVDEAVIVVSMVLSYTAVLLDLLCLYMSPI